MSDKRIGVAVRIRPLIEAEKKKEYQTQKLRIIDSHSV